MIHKKGLVEWLKVKALSSNPSTGKKKKMEPIAATSEGKLLAEKLVHGDLSFFLLLSHLVMETW
jgi:hypothetical protein